MTVAPIQCDRAGCVRGLLHRPGGWADPCNLCGGKGAVSRRKIARVIGEHPSAVCTLERMRVGPTRARRLLGKLMVLVGSAP